MAQISRRTLLRGTGAAVFAAGSAAVLPLFGTSGAEQDPSSCNAPDVSGRDRELVISNWPAYLDPQKKKTSTLREFERRTGISVSYTDDVSDNAEFFAKTVNQLSACETVKRDMFMLTDWMAARMIDLGWIQKLHRDKVPNLHANLQPALQDIGWDKERDFSAPWQTGLTGIAYNAAKTKEVRTFEELLTRKDLKGRVTLLSEMRDTMGFMVMVDGADASKFDDDEWGNGIDRLRRATSSGQIRAFTGNEYIQDLQAGNILACEAWSGDVIQAQFDNPDIKFVTPEEGLLLWSDNMLVPNKATHQANAEKWIDYYYEPKVAAKLAAYVNYICPVVGAQKEMEKIDPSLVDNLLIFPDEDMLSKTSSFMALDEVKIRAYEGDWADVTGG